MLLQAGGDGRYLALQSMHGLWGALPWVHDTVRFVFLAVAITAGGTLLNRSARNELCQHRAPAGLWLLHLATAAALVITQTILPRDSVLIAGTEPLYGLALGLQMLVLLSAVSLVIPPRLLLRSGQAAPAGLLVAAALYYMSSALSHHDGLAHFTKIIVGLTLDMSLWILSVLGAESPLIYTGANGNPIIAHNQFAISIAPSCAGYQGILAATAMLAIYLSIERRNLDMWRALPVAAIGVVGVFAMNALRIALLFMLGTSGHAELAVNGFHSNFGTVSLIVVLALLVLLLRHPFFGREEGALAAPAAVSRQDRNRHSDLALMIAPLSAVLFVSIMTGMWSGPVHWLYPLQAIVGAAVLWRLRALLLPQVAGFSLIWPILLGGLSYAVWTALVPTDPVRDEQVEAALRTAPMFMVIGWISFRVFGAALVVPMLEEMAFRAGIQDALTRFLVSCGVTGQRALTAGVILSATGFALMHSNFLAAWIVGLLYAWLYAVRRHLGEAVLAHATTNFLLTLHVLGSGAWSYW